MTMSVHGLPSTISVWLKLLRYVTVFVLSVKIYVFTISSVTTYCNFKSPRKGGLPNISKGNEKLQFGSAWSQFNKNSSTPLH